MLQSNVSMLSMKKGAYIIQVFFLIAVFGCDLEDPLADVDCNEIFRLEADKTSFLANGLDKITITATLSGKAKPALRVAFQTDYGIFEGSGNQPSVELTTIDRKASVVLKSTNTVESDITVSVEIEGMCRQFLSFSSEPALPDFIVFQSDRLEISANRSERAFLNVDLFRNPGRGVVSEMMRVDFESRPLDGSNARADHPEFAFSSNGAVSIDLRSATDTSGMVRIDAVVPAADGGVLRKSLDIQFVE